MDNSLAGLDDRLSESNWSTTGYPGGVLQSAASFTANGSPAGNLSGGGRPRVVVIHRDDRGFGFVVAGDNPVFVQTVREGGAAERAGIVKDDVIIKVNDVSVTKSNHAEVVDLIRAGGSSVSLTVVSGTFSSISGNGVPISSSNFHNFGFGMPSSPSSGGFGSPNSAPPPPPPPPHVSTSRSLHHQPSILRGGITSPQPVGYEQQRALELERLNTFKLMLEKEQQFVETKKSDLARGHNSAVAVELASAEKRVRELQRNYNQMAQRLGLSILESQPQSSTTFPVTANRPLHFPLRGNGGRNRTGMSESGGRDNLGCDVPPPLPARNRSLISQSSAPQLSTPPSDTAPPPPLPPRNPSTVSCPSTSFSSCSPQTMPDVVPPGPGPGNGGSFLPSNNDHRVQRDSPTNCSPSSSSVRRPNASPLPSHHRTKSSPFPFAVQIAAASTPDTRRFSSSDSISELDLQKMGSSTEGVDSPSHGTPPGTPPPPYRRPVSPSMEGANGIEGSASSLVSFVSQAPAGVLYSGREKQLNIASMEEDEFSDQETGQVDDHGVFKTLSNLLEHNAHLAVFINYLMLCSDPASLFFHLITDLYKEGTAKDMKKWAYEIHSTFLVPNAPLKVNSVDEHVLHEIDDALQMDIDKEEILRKVFWKARSKAKEELKRQLSSFCTQRTVGLGMMVLPPDTNLEETINDKVKETKVIEQLLTPHLESYSDDIENASDRDLAVASSLATIMQKIFNVKCPKAISFIERCPTFVAKEKSIKPKFLSKNKKCSAKGHHFVTHQYFSVTVCNHCQNILWGISPQGYQCTNCDMNIHKGCVKVVVENCVGALPRKDRGNDRISKIMGRIIPPEVKRKHSPLAPQADKIRRPEEKDSIEAAIIGPLELDPISGDKSASGPSTSNGRTFPDGTPDGARNRRSGTGSGSDSFGESDRRPGYTPPNDDDIDSTLSGTRKKAVSRSESLRERAQRKHHREKRKHSDPNLPPSHSSDVDLEGRSLSYNNSGSSSNSSLSTSLESPSPLDMVSSTRVSGSALSDGSSGVSVALSAISSTSVGTGSGAGNGPLTPWDSDIEIDPDPPDWTRNLDPEIVDKMSPKEKQRQEVINELFHTERSHVRNLKVLERVFYRPLLENGLLPTDLVNLLFPNLPEMLEIHGRFNNMMKARKRDQPAVESVGDILLSMFDGSSGENFQQAAALFCRNQSAALETLRDRRKKDTKLQVFLNEAEGNPVCRRLQLKDIIPTAMQRLTKYPLLLESLAKYTTPRSEEAATVRKCLERSREILNKVNQAVKEAENYHRLVEIQRRLDKSAFEKADHPVANELRNFELTKHRLIYEGALTWRTKGQKNVDLHVVLLEEYILLLQKQDDKYVLKFHSINYMGSKEESKFTHSPIIKIATVLVRPVATDKLALFLVNTSPSGAQIYDLVAVSIAERKAWFRHITDATEAYKTREGRNRRTDGSGGGPSPSGSHVPSLSASSSSAQLATTLESPEKIKDEEPTDDNISADSGVSLTPSSGETPPQNESSLNASDQQNQNLELIQVETAKKAGETSSTPTSGSASPGGGSSAASPAPQRRLQRVEILKIAEGTPLIDPAEVVVSQGAVLTAEPVLTPLEKLRRKDQLIRTALADKQRLVADMLHVPHSELESISESIGETEGEKEARLLVVAAMTQASRLATVLNETLRLTEEEAIAAVSDPTPALAAAAALSGGPATSPRPTRRVNRMPGAPTTKLLSISAALNRDLTQLLGIVSQRDEERDQLRRELQKARDQITELLLLQATPSLSNSRPLSHASSSDNEVIASSDQLDVVRVLEESSSILAPNSESESNSRNETLVGNPSSSETAESDVAQSAQCNQICDTSKEVTEEDKANTPCSAEKSSILLDTSQSSEA